MLMRVLSVEVFNPSLVPDRNLREALPALLGNLGQRVSKVFSDSRFSASEIPTCSLMVSFCKEPICVKFSVSLSVPVSLHSLLTEN